MSNNYPQFEFGAANIVRNERKIIVNVKEVVDTQGNMSYKAHCDDIDVPEGKTALLRWTVSDTDWKIIGIYGLDGDEFRDLGANGIGGWAYLNRNTKKMDYLYTGKLESKSGAQAILDPTVRNGGGGTADL